MNIRQLFDPASSTYSYLLWDEASRNAALIDSVKEQVDRDEQLIRELNLNLRYLLETHIHADHITGAGDLRRRFADKPLVAVHRASGSDCANQLLEDGDVLKLGEEEIRVLYTPGHTDTDVSYLMDGAVFTGDALLIRGSGRTDFQSGDAGKAWDSITGKLFTLADDTRVYPGHDYNGLTVSSIAEEKRSNPRLGNATSREDYMAIMNSMDLPKPQRIEEAVPGNLSCGLG
ncbi:MAG: MBL fold metallo-hydrolase [gamma proteobacterium symbiont of Bathyaustriella thionipta]|nr:MBL fold metallo-hydrolase [gamma proteobacterium symbiont of Bathyaustriella thionipta]